MACNGFILLVGSCEHGNEPLGSIKCRDFSSLAEELVASPKTLLCGVI